MREEEKRKKSEMKKKMREEEEISDAGVGLRLRGRALSIVLSERARLEKLVKRPYSVNEVVTTILNEWKDLKNGVEK